MRNGKFYNLETEMLKAQISRKELAKTLNLSEWGLNNKLKGRNEFKLSEMEKIREALSFINGEKLKLDYLFEREKE